MQPDSDNPQLSHTRARTTKKIPANIKNSDGSYTHLTRKQRSIIRRIPTADSFGQIANELRCSKGYVSDTYHLPAVQNYIKTQLDAAGATHGKIFQRIAEGLDATKEDRAGGERPDFGERRESAKLALRIQGLDTVPEDRENTVTNNTIFNIVIQARKDRGLSN